MKMNKSIIKRYISALVILLAIAASLIRYYSLNGSFRVNDIFEKEVYNLNEPVDMGENKCANFNPCPGWNLEIIGSEIYESDDFYQKYNVEDSESQYTKKILEVNLRVTNTSDDLNSIGINFFQVLGIDWYTTLNTELTYKSNKLFNEHCEQSDMGLSLHPNSSYDIKMIYNLYEWIYSKKKYKNINSENMYFELTIMPKNKLIWFRK